MKNQGLIWGLAVSLLILGGCGIKPEEPPVVFEKMSNAMSKVEQLEFSGDFQVVGNSTIPLFQGLQDLQISGNGRTNLTEVNNLRYLLNLAIKGKSSEGDTEIGTEIISFPDCSYFRLTNIVMPLGLPFSLAPNNKWYKTKSGGQNLDWLGSTQPVTPEQTNQIRVLIAQSKLFNVVQKFPDETVGGGRTYHWQVAVDAEALRVSIRDLTNLTGPATDMDIDHIVAMLSDYTYEFWINKYDHRLMRADIKGWYDSPEHQRVDFTVKFNFDKFSSVSTIDRPSNVQEFDLRQMLGLPAITQ